LLKKRVELANRVLESCGATRVGEYPEVLYSWKLDAMQSCIVRDYDLLPGIALSHDLNSSAGATGLSVIGMIIAYNRGREIHDDCPCGQIDPRYAFPCHNIHNCVGLNGGQKENPAQGNRC
jgi:hypothetical protein